MNTRTYITIVLLSGKLEKKSLNIQCDKHSAYRSTIHEERSTKKIWNERKNVVRRRWSRLVECCSMDTCVKEWIRSTIAARKKTLTKANDLRRTRNQRQHKVVIGNVIRSVLCKRLTSNAETGRVVYTSTPGEMFISAHPEIYTYIWHWSKNINKQKTQ